MYIESYAMRKERPGTGIICINILLWMIYDELELKGIEYIYKEPEFSINLSGNSFSTDYASGSCALRP